MNINELVVVMDGYGVLNIDDLKNFRIVKIKVFPVTPSLNQWQRMHWIKRSQLGRDYSNLLKWASIRLNEIHFITPVESLEIIRYSSRELDYDNLVGGAKPLVDALVLNNIIIDDSPDKVDIKYHQKKSNHSGKCTIIRMYN